MSALIDRTDSELVAGSLESREGCFEELHRRYWDRIYSFALRRLRDPFEAEDVTQDVFLQTHRCLASFQGRSSVLTWMLGIATNQVRRHFRRRGAIPTPAEELETLGDAPPISSWSVVEGQIDASRALAECGHLLSERVSPDHRQVFYLHYSENRSTRAIAEELGRSNESIKISLHRTRRLLHDGAMRGTSATPDL